MVKLIIVLPTMRICRDITRELRLPLANVVLVTHSDIDNGGLVP